MEDWPWLAVLWGVGGGGGVSERVTLSDVWNKRVRASEAQRLRGTSMDSYGSGSHVC